MSKRVKTVTVTKRNNPQTQGLRRTALTLAKAVRGKSNVSFLGKQKRSVSALGKITSAPVNTAVLIRSGAPKFSGLKNGVRIKHREYVGDIITAGTAGDFKCERYIINAANSDTFPWLANQARSYSEYKFHSLSFKLESLLSSATNGMFGLASTPDILDTAPTEKSAFMQLQNSVRNKIWEHVSHSVPKDVLNRLPHYLTAANNLTTSDSTRDIGSIFICTSDVATSNLGAGELYVEYDIELSHPQQVNGLSATAQSLPTLNSVNQFTDFALSETGSNILISNNAGLGAFGATDTLVINASGDVQILYVLEGTVITSQPFFTAYKLKTVGGTATPVALTVTSTEVGDSVRHMTVITVQNAPKPFYFRCTTAPASTTVTGAYITVCSMANTTNNLPQSLESRFSQLSKRVSSLVDDNDEYIVPENTPQALPVTHRSFSLMPKLRM